MMDKSSLFVQAFLPCHSLIDCRNWDSFSLGSQSSIVTVSISIPREVVHHVGPSDFFASMGTPAVSHVVSIRYMLFAHSFEFGLPRVIKSSI